MVEYPISFSSESHAEGKEKSWTLKTDEGLQTQMTVPTEFGGDNKNPSPEDLFSASLQTCLIATFKSIAERKNLNYREIICEANLELDRGEDSRPVMKKGEIELEVEGIEDIEKAEKVSKATEKNCFIHNSVKTDLKIEFEFEK